MPIYCKSDVYENDSIIEKIKIFEASLLVDNQIVDSISNSSEIADSSRKVYFTKNISKQTYKNKETAQPPQRKKILIELNSTDSVSIQQLYGIGQVLSKRIIKYRDYLGGFYSENQLLEVYGLTAETFAKIEKNITVDTLLIKRLNINNLPYNSLKKHPYIKDQIASKIIKYRASNGKILNIKQLQQADILTKEELDRIKNYIEF